MKRLFLASIAVVSALAVVPYAVDAQKPTPNKGALPKSNQVYVKVILPIDPATRDRDRPVVEAWIAEQVKKRGQSKFTAATAWVPLSLERFGSTEMWDGGLDGKAWGCPVDGNIYKRADGRIKVFLNGPGGAKVIVSLKDEVGSREIAVVEGAETEQGMPYGYVAVLIGPPPEKPAAPTDHEK
jgi:hypothetical protein